MHKKVTEETLRDLDVDGIPRICVYNKADLRGDKNIANDRETRDPVYISAKTGYGIDDLLDAIREIVNMGNRMIDICVPYNEGSLLDRIHREAEVISENFEEDGIHITANCPAALADHIEQLKLKT